MASEADLIERTLRVAGLIGVGQPPEPEDAENVRKNIQGKLDELAARNVVSGINPKNFPEVYLEWLAVLLAQTIAPEYGGAIDAETVILAEARLRSINSSRVVSRRAQPEYM